MPICFSVYFFGSLKMLLLASLGLTFHKALKIPLVSKTSMVILRQKPDSALKRWQQGSFDVFQGINTAAFRLCANVLFPFANAFVRHAEECTDAVG